MGTPEIARVVLDGLVASGEGDVLMAFCQPDRARGRGKKVLPPPVKVRAEALGIPVFQPTKLRDGAVASQLADAKLDLAIVVAYGRILPVDVFEAPAFNTWNVHASLLPRHRGASPIQHAILHGDSKTGVTLMQLSEGMDEGDMLLKQELLLEGDETGGSLTRSLADVGAAALVDGLRRAKRDGLVVTPQPEDLVTYAPLLKKQDGALDFAEPAEALARRIRAFDPWPGTFVATDQGPLKVLAAERVEASGPSSPGRVAARDPALIVATGEGALRIDRLQPPGKNPMSSADFLRGRGRHIQIGDLLAKC